MQLLNNKAQNLFYNTQDQTRQIKELDIIKNKSLNNSTNKSNFLFDNFNDLSASNPAISLLIYLEQYVDYLEQNKENGFDISLNNWYNESVNMLDSLISDSEIMLEYVKKNYNIGNENNVIHALQTIKNIRARLDNVKTKVELINNKYKSFSIRNQINNNPGSNKQYGVKILRSGLSSVYTEDYTKLFNKIGVKFPDALEGVKKLSKYRKFVSAAKAKFNKLGRFVDGPYGLTCMGFISAAFAIVSSLLIPVPVLGAVLGSTFAILTGHVVRNYISLRGRKEMAKYKNNSKSIEIHNKKLKDKDNNKNIDDISIKDKNTNDLNIKDKDKNIDNKDNNKDRISLNKRKQDEYEDLHHINIVSDNTGDFKSIIYEHARDVNHHNDILD